MLAKNVDNLSTHLCTHTQHIHSYVDIKIVNKIFQKTQTQYNTEKCRWKHTPFYHQTEKDKNHDDTQYWLKYRYTIKNAEIYCKRQIDNFQKANFLILNESPKKKSMLFDTAI